MIQSSAEVEEVAPVAGVNTGAILGINPSEGPLGLVEEEKLIDRYVNSVVCLQ